MSLSDNLKKKNLTLKAQIGSIKIFQKINMIKGTVFHTNGHNRSSCLFSPSKYNHKTLNRNRLSTGFGSLNKRDNQRVKTVCTKKKKKKKRIQLIRKTFFIKNMLGDY